MTLQEGTETLLKGCKNIVDENWDTYEGKGLRCGEDGLLCLECKVKIQERLKVLREVYEELWNEGLSNVNKKISNSIEKLKEAK